MNAPLWWMGIHIKSDDPDLLNAVQNMMPHNADSRLWFTKEYEIRRDIDKDGVAFIFVSLFFNDLGNRTDFKTALLKINNFIHGCLPGSFIKMSRCWHNSLLDNGSPEKKDELQYEEVVV